jgi:hypothetical protein
MFPSYWDYKASTTETESRILTYLGALDVPYLAKHETKIVDEFDQNILFVSGNSGIF